MVLRIRGHVSQRLGMFPSGVEGHDDVPFLVLVIDCHGITPFVIDILNLRGKFTLHPDKNQLDLNMSLSIKWDMVRKTIAGILSALILMGASNASIISQDASLEQKVSTEISENPASDGKAQEDDFTIKTGRIYDVDEEEISYLVTCEDGNTYPQTLCFELLSIRYMDAKEKWHWARMVLPGPQLVKEGSMFNCTYIPCPDEFLSYNDLVKEYGVEGVDYNTQKGGLLVDGIMLLGFSE